MPVFQMEVILELWYTCSFAVSFSGNTGALMIDKFEDELPVVRPPTTLRGIATLPYQPMDHREYLERCFVDHATTDVFNTWDWIHMYSTMVDRTIRHRQKLITNRVKRMVDDGEITAEEAPALIYEKVWKWPFLEQQTRADIENRQFLWTAPYPVPFHEQMRALEG